MNQNGKQVVEKARVYATAAHASAKNFRKYTGEPYIVHPIRVASILEGYYPEAWQLHAAGLLHDVIEDAHITQRDLASEFPLSVVKLVVEVTDQFSDHPDRRAVRSKMEARRLATVSEEAKILKVADMLANLRDDIVEKDVKFAKAWLSEKLHMMEKIDSVKTTPIYSRGMEELSDAFLDLSKALKETGVY